ncbi:MAG: GTP cyclohydrolase FolE2, partial [Planctomycetota bacterium]
MDDRHVTPSTRDQDAMMADGVLGPARHPQRMPDVAVGEPAHDGGRLDRVGMAGVQAMARIADEAGVTTLVPAEVDAFVSLDDPHARGIHMSRLYLDLQGRFESEDLSLDLLHSVLDDFIVSQQGLSRDAELSVRCTWPLHRRALLSDHRGWRHYPVCLVGQVVAGVFRGSLRLTLTYSSTCPCSAALSRQAMQEAFVRDVAADGAVDAAAVIDWLGGPGLVATPHSQRSDAVIDLVPAAGLALPAMVELVDRFEAALATPVQTAVKREDEQEFARRNAANLMFCEDAARRLRDSVRALPGL